MTINILELLQIELYVAVIILVVVLIILAIRFIKTLSKVDKTVDEISDKISKVDGVFNVVEKTGNFVDGVSDKFIMLISGIVGKLLNRKKGNDDDE